MTTTTTTTRILVAVNKCRYESVEEGMAHTIGIFIKTALELVRKKHIKVSGTSGGGGGRRRKRISNIATTTTTTTSY